MKKILNIFKLILGWPISVLAIFFVFKIIYDKSGSVFFNLSYVNYQLLLYGLVLYVLFYFLRSYVWKEILKEKEHDLPFREASFLWGVSELKRYTPGNIWSFLGRALLFSKKGVPNKITASSILLEVEIFLLACFIISLLSISFIVFNFLPFYLQTNLVSILIIVTILLVLIVFIFGNLISKKITLFSFLHHLVPFSSDVNFKLLILSVIYMVIYGLGTYLTVASVVFLNPSYITTFIGFFSFSLLIGYLSIITPMGLGVREGVMMLGLSKFITLSQAAFVSIFSRIILILSELIYISISFLIYKTKNRLISKVEYMFKNYKHEIILLFLVMIYALYFTNITFLKQDNFYTGRFDLGNMDQTVWNTINGNIFKLTNPDGTDITSRLSFHADFLLVLISPLYLIWNNPKMLLLLQTIILSIGAIYIYLIAKNVLKYKNLAIVFSFAFLINPSVNYSNLFDFHAVTLATTFLLASFYYLLKKRTIYFILFLLLAALSKEQVWILASISGLFVVVQGFLDKKKNNIVLGLLIAIISSIVFYLLVWKLIPQTRGKEHFALEYYSEFGGSPSGIVRNILTSPIKTLGTLFEYSKIDYLRQIFSPLGYLSFLAPLYLIFSAPDLSINLLSSNKQLHQIYFQYTSAITPFIFISAIYASKLLTKYFPKLKVLLFFYVLFFASYASYIYGPLPFAKKPNLDMLVKPINNKDKIELFLSSIPKNYSVATSNSIGSHLSQRKKIFTIPFGLDEADIIIFNLNDSFPQPSRETHFRMVSELRVSKYYKKVFEEGSFVAFEKIKP